MIVHSTRIRALFSGLIFCLALAIELHAASKPRIFFDRLSVESGLSQSIVTAVYQDHRGFLWVGTTDGLNLYNGYDFTIYRHDPKDTRGLSHSYVTAILEDRRGRLWVGTMNGLNVLEAGQRSFRRLLADPQNPQSLSDANVRSLYEDRAGTLWVGTANGLNRLVEAEDPQSMSFLGFGAVAMSGPRRTPFSVSSLLEDLAGRLWVGIPRQGIYSFDRERRTFTRVWPAAETPAAETPEIFCLYEDREGRIWMGTDAGVLRVDQPPGPEAAATLQPVRAKEGESVQADTLIIYDIVEDRSGTLWAGTYGKGLIRIDPASGAFERVGHDPRDATSLSNDFVTSLAFDAGGFLWVGTSGGGLNRQNRTRERIESFACAPDDPMASGRNQVFAILEDGPGRILLGTRSGLCLLASGRNAFTLWDERSLPGPLTSEFIRTLVRDGGGRIWIGTEAKQNGLFRFDPATGRFDQFRASNASPESFSSNVVRCAAVDRAGDLWVGTPKAGLERVAAEDLAKPVPVFRHYRRPESAASPLSQNSIRVLLAGRDGTLWIGTEEGGLNALPAAQMDSANPEYLVFGARAEGPNSQGGDPIISLWEDRAGRIWVGTAKSGLGLLNPEKRAFEWFSRKDGLPDETVYAIYDDEDGDIWVSTNGGLAELDPTTRRVRTFDVRDGLQANEFNTGAVLRLGDGRLLFGGVSGLSAVDPRDGASNGPPPAVAITQLAAAYPGGDAVASSGVKLPVMSSAMIRLPYRNAGFKARLAVLDLRAPWKNVLSCRLSGQEKKWTLRDGQNRLEIPVLDPGRYTLEVRGMNSDGIWCERPVTLTVIVRRPFWGTPLFIAGLALLAASGAAIVLKMRKALAAARLPGGTDLSVLMDRYELSQREQEIMNLLMQGRKNKDIAKELFISENTVKVHVYNIYKKLGVGSRLEILDLLRRIKGA